MNRSLSLLEAINKYKRVTKFTKIPGRNHDNLTRSVEAAESNKTIAEVCGVYETTLRKRWKIGTIPTSLGRFMATFSNDEEK
jgi:hypothetical protein